MSQQYFNVTECNKSGCQSWRIGNKCTWHGMSMEFLFKTKIRLHDPVTCKVRRQLDIYRVEEMLDG